MTRRVPASNSTRGVGAQTVRLAQGKTVVSNAATTPLDAALIEGFQRAYLWERFDGAAPTPQFHRIMWGDAADPTNVRCAWAAPRGHAKSTGITLTFALAAIVFRFRDYLVIISDSEGQAVAFLKDLKIELSENEDLRKDFQVGRMIKDTETELEMEFSDGYVFRVVAKGSEQKFRGMKWRNKRPNLIIGDDLEFDEVVMNPERRNKFKDNFIKQVIPCGAENCLYRIVGTILHFDSLLMNLMSDPAWTSRLWAAHAGFDDFKEILWPERYSEEDLRSKRQVMINMGKSDAYSQEYLNRPLAEGSTFFRKGELLAIPEHLLREFNGEGTSPAGLNYYVSVDFAISQKQTADRSCITVASLDPDGYLDIVDVIKGRFDSKELIALLFEVDERYGPELYLMENGTIQKSIGPFLNEEMRRKNRFFNIELLIPAVDKVQRAQAIRARIRAGYVRFDKGADWWPDNEEEMLQFPRGGHDDFVDTLSQFGLALDEIITPASQEELDEEEYESERRDSINDGRNRVTGY